MTKIDSEWFGSKESAVKAAKRCEAKGYATKVTYALAANGYRNWLLEIFA